MPYTVKQVATMSGVSVRTLHFYDEVGLLKPAFYGDNGYRFYEQAQLLMLQQILFYREIGFDLYQIKQTLGRGDFEKAAALRSHREILQKNIDRMRKLMETIDREYHHASGWNQKMEDKDMFAGFSVGAGEDRFDQIEVRRFVSTHWQGLFSGHERSHVTFEFTGTGAVRGICITSRMNGCMS